MTTGEKIKEARKSAGLSQEKLSEILGVSRSAVAKWEADNGIPDADNLKALSELLSVSIDYLLKDGENTDKSVIKEPIDLSLYDGARRAKKDKCVRDRYPQAKITPLIAKTKPTKKMRIFDNLLGIFTDAPFGTAEVYNDLKDVDKQYYLAEQGEKQFLILVTDEFIVSRELARKQYSDKFEIDNVRFTNCSYEVK